MAGRPLRLLLINDDNPGDFYAPFIEVVECPTGFGDDVKPQLRTWAQHIWLWGKDQVPNFDLLLIDIKFERDTTDPSYFGEPEGPQLLTSTPPEHAPNPFGLLHALPLVAQQALTNMPFVWGVHSGDPRAVQNDPVAIWALGLLYAMERREGWDGYYSAKPASISAYFQAQLEAMQALDPPQAWRSLLLPYRTQLLEACKARVYVDPDPLQKLIAMAEDIARATGDSRESLDRLAKESLFMYAGYDDEHALLVRSLFADVADWDQRTVATDVLGYLRQLGAAATHVRIFPHVYESICKLDADRDAKLRLTQILPRLPNRASIGVGVIVCLWLRRFYNGETRRAQDLLTDIGFFQDGVENWHAPNRLLHTALGRHVPLGKFLTRLEHEPLPTVWRECGLEFYNDVLHANMTKPLPRCLGQE